MLLHVSPFIKNIEIRAVELRKGHKMNNERLERENITKLILRYAVPSMIAILVSTIYNIIDRIFIGRFVGPEALAGLTFVYPIMMVIFAGSALIGRGGANLLSIQLGKKDKEGARQVFTTTVVITVLFGAVMSVVGYFSLKPILSLLGAEGHVLTFGYDYMAIIFIGVIFWILSFTLSSTVRAEGQANLSMIAMIGAALTNILLDYLLIVQFNLGVRGAAIGTIIAQTVGCGILAYYYLVKSKSVVFKRKYIKLEMKIVKRIVSIGLPSYFVTVGGGISLMVLNRYLGLYGGVGAVASIGAIGSLMTFFNIPALGIQNGIQPIIGYNHGAEKTERIRETLIKSVTMTFITGCILFVLIRIHAPAMIQLFLETPEYVPMGSYGLKMYALLIPLTAIINISTAYFQATENASQAIMISSFKQIVCLIPLVMIFSRLWGINGIWHAIPVADGLTILLSLILVLRNSKSMTLAEQV